MNRAILTSESALRRRCKAWCMAVAAGIALLGCAASGVPADAAVARPLLALSYVLGGAPLQSPPGSPFGAPVKPGATGYLPFLAPVAVAARNNVVYIVDRGHRQIFRYDPAQLSMSRFADHAAGAVSAVAVAPDLSLYVADAGARQVLHFSWDGKQLRGFGNDIAVARPVGVALDEASGQLLVADSLYKHVVVFNSLGYALATLRPLEARSIDAMARGPDGLYLVDRVSRRVVVMGPDGVERYMLGAGTLKDPQAIAVDEFNRVFVADGFDNTIRVYDRRQLIASFGRTGAVPGSFNRIGFLWFDHGMLYVADSGNARIQAFRVAPPTVQGPAHE